ncbi:conserved hypothetical protein [Leishmania mexicana MHOM/GT/2001/U1103]|uniref:Uncharacterized protein n=1 Tax=Leishmania mexicana (strain MHOM/GT/2001/U1103) TaxID=929439 RepID=E9AW92_LEIMU|nr:conserved hypothetical protein [Leishmania mexicana MHOM/GT/2001/U1103]CBZ27226.1 conserved hypothetical protein [Leishmania mexicana MHOM/GT/2001/U1103]
MWAALPPVVSVVTAAEELAGVSMAAHTSGMMCESNTGSCPPATVDPTRCSRPNTLGASSVMSHHHASLVSDEHLESLNGSQCGHCNRTAFPPPEGGDGAACETAAPVTAAATGDGWSRQARPGSHAAPPSLPQPRLERHTFQPLASPPTVGVPASIMSSPAVCPISGSLFSRQAVASPGQDVLGYDPSGSPVASPSMGVTAVDTRPSPGLGPTWASSFHQAPPPLCLSGSPLSLAAAGSPAGDTACASTMMLPSASSHAAPKSTPVTNSGAALPLLRPAPTGTAHDSTAAHTTVNPFQAWPSVSLTASAATTAAGQGGAPSWAAAECQAQNHQVPAPLACPSYSSTPASALTPTPHTSAIVSCGALRHSSSPVTSALSPGGGASSPGSAGNVIQTPSFKTPVCVSGPPPRHSSEGAPLRTLYALPSSMWEVGGASSNTNRTAFTAATSEGMNVSSPKISPQLQHVTFAQLGNSGSASAGVSDAGHGDFQAPAPAQFPPVLDPPTLRQHPHPGGGAERANVGAGTPRKLLDGSVCSATLSNHNHSFYMGTTGNDNLSRSFLFPLTSSCGAAVAADGTEDASVMSAGGGGPRPTAISHVRSPSVACGRHAGQATPPMPPVGSTGVAVYGVSDSVPSSEAGSILADTCRSLAPFELPPLQYASQLLQGQPPSHQPHPQLQPSLRVPSASAVTTLPPPGPPHSIIFCRSPQMTSLNEALPGLAQPVTVSHAPAMGRGSSFNQSPALQQLSTGHSRSPSAHGATAAEASLNAGATNSSFISPTVASLKWHCRFEGSLSGSENAIELPDSSAQVTGSTAAAPAPGDGRSGASSRPSLSIADAKPAPRPGYIVEWEQSLTAFQSRAESYYAFKNVCTDTYLTLIEHNVDRFLVCYFSGGAIRPERSLQEALASRTGAAANTPTHLFSGTGAGNLNAQRPGGQVTSGAGIQKMLQGSKALLLLSETGSKWLTKIGVNLRRTTATPAPVSSEPQTALMSADPAHRATPAFAGTVASPLRSMREGSPDCRTTPMTIGASGAATAAVEETRVLEPAYTSLCDADPFGASLATSTAPGRLPPPATHDSISSTSTSQLALPSTLPHTGATTEMGTGASTMAAALPARFSAEEVEIQCLRYLGPYVANVVPETFMDARPSEGVLDQVRRNYAILLHTLQHVLLDANSSSRQVTDASSPYVESTLPSPTILTHTPSLTLSTGTAGSPGCTRMNGLVSQRIRQGLLLPTIQATWRDYLTPLKCKVRELTQIATTSIEPILRDLQSPWVTGATGGAAAVPLIGPASPGRVLRHDSTAAATPFTKEVKASFVAMTDAERAAREALRASWEGPVSRLIRLLRGDEEYLATIQTMDNEFIENGAAWQESSAQLRLSGAALSDYVPVYGLVLSRLHRLEMEHRTVLELWGGSAAAAAGTQHRMYA